MPADSSRPLRAINHPAFDQRRRSERRACALTAVIDTGRGAASARITDLSACGIGFVLDTVLALRPGERMLMRHDQLGSVPCVIRWVMHPRYGAEFDAGGKLLAQINAFYDSLPHHPRAAG